MLKKINIHSIAIILILLYSLSSEYSINHIHCNSPQQISKLGDMYDFSDCTSTCSCQNRDNNSSSSSHENGKCNVVIDHIITSIEDVSLNETVYITIATGIKLLTVQYYLSVSERIDIFNEYPPNEYLTWSKTLRAPPVSLFV